MNRQHQPLPMPSQSAAATASFHSRPSTEPSTIKPRQMSHLHSQLAQLQANLSDLESLVRVTAVQAEYIKRLGGLQGALFLAAGRVFERDALGEKSPARQDQQVDDSADVSR
ncbi:DASH complex subunit Hsk3 like-domain-containing protein [Lipomyces orientalis]|uniref:DASH complex subunit Hsk3 like-domain-containing protein n=1 Tax=Lipomyces orientalis TaxID=1233043 RepID=A0ACC3TF18_9ASCO